MVRSSPHHHVDQRSREMYDSGFDGTVAWSPFLSLPPWLWRRIFPAFPFICSADQIRLEPIGGLLLGEICASFYEPTPLRIAWTVRTGTASCCRCREKSGASIREEKKNTGHHSFTTEKQLFQSRKSGEGKRAGITASKNRLSPCLGLSWPPEWLEGRCPLCYLSGTLPLVFAQASRSGKGFNV